jgi:hypothetical protein
MLDERTLISGLVVSTTFTTNDAFDVFAAASEAEQLTVVCPNGKVEPDAGEHDAVTSPSTKSDAAAK